MIGKKTYQFRYINSVIGVKSGLENDQDTTLRLVCPTKQRLEVTAGKVKYPVGNACNDAQ